MKIEKRKRYMGLSKTLLTAFCADYQRFPNYLEVIFMKNEINVNKLYGHFCKY